MFPLCGQKNLPYNFDYFRKDLVGLLSAARESLDVKLLLAVLQKTVAFEKYLTQRFGVVQGPHGPEVCGSARGVLGLYTNM